MKAMSLRISMQTLSPWPTPSFCSPLAIRSARSATSSWLRRRFPLMMPWKRGEVDIVSFRSVVGFKGTKPSFRDAPLGAGPESILMMVVMDSGLVSLRYTPRNDESCLSRLRKARGALFEIGADGFGLVGTAHQLHLLDGLGHQRRTGIDGQIVEHALAGADGVRILAGDLAREFEGRRTRILADTGGEAIAQRLLRRKNPPRVSQLAQNIVAHQAREDRRARHV